MSWNKHWCVCVTQLCSWSRLSPLDAAFPPQTDAVKCRSESGAMSQCRGAPQNGVAPLSVPPAHGVGVDALAVTGCGFIKGVMQMGGIPSAIPGDGTSGLARTARGMLTAGKVQALERVNHLHGQITLQGGRKGSSEQALQLVRVEIGGSGRAPQTHRGGVDEGEEQGEEQQQCQPQADPAAVLPPDAVAQAAQGCLQPEEGPLGTPVG